MEVRYTGPLQGGVEVPWLDPDTGVAENFVLERMEWTDLPTDVARSLGKQDTFELRGPKRAAQTRKRNEAEEPEAPAAEVENGEVG